MSFYLRGCLITDRDLASDFYQMLNHGKISVRLYNGLMNSGVMTLANAAARGERAFRKQKNVGKKTLAELRALLEENGLTFADAPKA